MITAIDSSVLFDVFLADPSFGPGSREALRRAGAEGMLVACDVVWAEVAAAFPDKGAAAEALQRLHVEFRPLRMEDAVAAGAAWRTYRRRGGPRERVIADFLIGAHAGGAAERLLTRDRGFYWSYFSHVKLLIPI